MSKMRIFNGFLLRRFDLLWCIGQKVSIDDRGIVIDDDQIIGMYLIVLLFI